MVTSLLSDADARDVEAAIARVERLTAAELVVAVLPHSADHWRGRMLASLTWSLAAALAVLRFWPAKPPILALVVQVAAGALTFAVLGWAPLRRLFVSRAAAERAAHARAFQLFAERGLYGTEARTALLIFVSELERRVVLLGDATIHAELGQSGWQREVSRLVQHIAKNRLRDGLIEVIAELEPRLAAVAPPTASNPNELPDSIVRE